MRCRGVGSRSRSVGQCADCLVVCERQRKRSECKRGLFAYGCRRLGFCRGSCLGNVIQHTGWYMMDPLTGILIALLSSIPPGDYCAIVFVCRWTGCLRESAMTGSGRLFQLLPGWIFPSHAYLGVEYDRNCSDCAYRRCRYGRNGTDKK